jgi:ABC-2 type transport system ATP-binding protein
MNAAVEIQQIVKQYGSTLAVDHVSLSIPEGTIYGFLGPNGAGKTSTIRMMMRIILPDEGSIRILGGDLASANLDRVGYLPEERGLYKKMTVRRLLTYYGRLKGASAAKVSASVERWLARMGLEAYADKRVEALSKGMSQKVQFMSTVVSEPEVVILDEPFSGLDPVNADVLKDAVLDLRRSGVTVVFSTHDMAVAERLCDRICMIFKGRKVLDGSMEEIQAQYGYDTVRLRTSGGAAALGGLAGIDAINDYGQLQEIRLSCDPQQFLQRLAAKTAVNHFEIARPSLHDIFVRIARPTD